LTHDRLAQVSALDVGPGDSRALATGGADGALRFSDWSGATASTSTAVEPKGILGDVTDIRFVRRVAATAHLRALRRSQFPSGEVVLVASSDFRVRVFGLQGSNPRTLTGHTRSVEACLPLPPKGRLVLSASRDSSVRLWRVADAAALYTFALSAPAHALAVGVRPPGFEGGLRPPDGDDPPAAPDPDLEPGLLGLAGLADGTIAVLDLSARSQLSTLSGPSSSGVLAVDYDATTGWLVAGHADGLVHVQRLDGTPVARWRRSSASVHAVLFSSTERGARPTVLVAGEDGLPYRVALRGGEGEEGVRVEVVEEFMGIVRRLSLSVAPPLTYAGHGRRRGAAGGHGRRVCRKQGWLREKVVASPA
jgi:hypothetical protein